MNIIRFGNIILVRKLNRKTTMNYIMLTGVETGKTYIFKKSAVVEFHQENGYTELFVNRLNTDKDGKTFSMPYHVAESAELILAELELE